MGEESWRYVFR